MQRTTIMLPPELKIAAQKHASSLGISVGKLIRNALQQCLETEQKGKDADLLFSDFSTYDKKTPNDLSSNHDIYLYGNEK